MAENLTDKESWRLSPGWCDKTEIKTLKHKQSIQMIFEMLFEPWMDDSDKFDFVIMSLAAIGKTIKDIDQDIQLGVENGHSAEFQVEMLRKILTQHGAGKSA